MAGKIGIAAKVRETDLECKKVRISCVVYDNGRTPSSSETNFNSINFVKYNWPLQSKGLNLFGNTKGVGQLLGPKTGWTAQFTDNTGQNGKDGVDLEAWVPYFNQVIEDCDESDKTCAGYAVLPASSWRVVKITSVSPCFSAGKWNLCRLDRTTLQGNEVTVYPVLPEEQIIQVFCRNTFDKKTRLPETEFYQELKDENGDIVTDDNGNTQFEKIDAPTWQPYQGAPPETIPLDCYIDCEKKFDPIIEEDAISQCLNYTLQELCVFNGEPIVPDLSNLLTNIVLFMYDCPTGRITEIYTQETYIDSLSSDDPLDPETDQYLLPEGAVIANCDGSAFEEPPLPECPQEVAPNYCYYQEKTAAIRPFGDANGMGTGPTTSFAGATLDGHICGTWETTTPTYGSGPLNYGNTAPVGTTNWFVSTYNSGSGIYANTIRANSWSKNGACAIKSRLRFTDIDNGKGKGEKYNFSGMSGYSSIDFSPPPAAGTPQPYYPFIDYTDFDPALGTIDANGEFCPSDVLGTSNSSINVEACYRGDIRNQVYSGCIDGGGQSVSWMQVTYLVPLRVTTNCNTGAIELFNDADFDEQDPYNADGTPKLFTTQIPLADAQLKPCCESSNYDPACNCEFDPFANCSKDSELIIRCSEGAQTVDGIDANGDAVTVNFNNGDEIGYLVNTCDGIVTSYTVVSINDATVQINLPSETAPQDPAVDPFLTKDCDPAPEISDPYCVEDEKGIKWDCFKIISTVSGVTEVCFNAETGEAGTPIGETTLCEPEDCTLTDFLKLCPNPCAQSAIRLTTGRPAIATYDYAGISGETIQEFEANWAANGGKAYITNQNGTGDGTGSNEAHWICPAVSGATLLVNGEPATNALTISPNTYAQQFLGCEDEKALHVTLCQADLDKLIDNQLGEDCETPIYTKECPPEPCPAPSMEIYCDADDTKYVTVTHASDLCGTSGTYLADAYFADPQVLTAYTPTGTPKICDDSTIKDSKCLIDECGTKWSCVDIINTVGDQVVESQTCVPYIEPDCPAPTPITAPITAPINTADAEPVTPETADAEPVTPVEKKAISKEVVISKEATLTSKTLAVKSSVTSVKSIKLSVATVNTQIESTVTAAGEMPVPVGETCPCPCGASEASKPPVKNIWMIDTATPNGIVGKRWIDNAAEHGPTSNQFSDCKTHVNGDPDEEVVITNNWILNDLDFPVTGSNFATSQALYYAWVYFPQATILKDTNGNTGEWLTAFIGGCGQKPQKVAEFGSTGAGQVGLDEFTQVPAGLYQIVLQESDFSVYGGLTIQESTDGGDTFALIPMSRTFSQQPSINCHCVSVCDGEILDIDGNAIIFDDQTMSWCEISCPTVDSLADQLPDYEFSIVDGCDSVDYDPANYVNVTRETVYVDGVPTTTFFTNYGDDALQQEYTMIGLFVDCTTGEQIGEEPTVPLCVDWEILDAYLPIGTNGMNLEVWNGTDAVTGLPSTAGPSAVFTGPIDYSGMPSHPNAFTGYTCEDNLRYVDRVNDQSQFRYWSYLYTTTPIRIRENGGTAEAIDFYVGECCATPTLTATGAYPNTPNTTGPQLDISLPAGVHYLGGTVFDFSAYSAITYQYSDDNGATWKVIPASWLYKEKPQISKCPVKYCPETQIFADAVTGNKLGTEVSLCQPDLCSPIAVQSPTGPKCTLITLYEVEKRAGAVETKWTTNAVSTTTASGHTYLEAFTATDAEGYPAHVNPADVTGQVVTTTSTTNVLQADGITDDQATLDFWLCIPYDVQLIENNPTAEAVGVWASESCGSSTMKEILSAPYLNSGTNELGLFSAGIYRFRLYHHDVTANGIARLRYRNPANNVSTVIPADWISQSPPAITPVYAWCCDDGKIWNKDKSEELTLSSTLMLEDLRCTPSPCGCGSNDSSATPQTLRVQVNP